VHHWLAAATPHVWRRRPNCRMCPGQLVAYRIPYSRVFTRLTLVATRGTMRATLASAMRLFAYVQSRRSWALRAAVVAMATLVLAVGFCVFDGHDHDGAEGHASLDLCFGMLTVSLPMVLVGGLPLTGLPPAYQLTRFRDFPPHVPAPPPKRFS